MAGGNILPIFLASTLGIGDSPCLPPQAQDKGVSPPMREEGPYPPHLSGGGGVGSPCNLPHCIGSRTAIFSVEESL